MRNKLSNRQSQSVLGKAAYSSFMPSSQSQFYNTASKFTYLPTQSNANQMIIKEMINTERKFEKQAFRSSFYSPSNIRYEPPKVEARAIPRQNHYSSRQSDASSVAEFNDFRSTIENNLRGLSKIQPKTDTLNSPVKFARSHLRRRSFDPILGHEKEYNTPYARFNTLGVRGHDSYNIQGFFRQPSITHFTPTLRGL